MAGEVSGKSRLWVWGGGAAVLVAVCLAWFLLPLDEWAQAFQGWVTGKGAFGVAIFAAVYLVAVVVLAPVWPLSIAAGLAYGFWAILFVLLVGTVGAALAFLVSRHLVQGKARRLLEGRPKFKAVDKAASEEGWKVVMLLRLSPLVPYNLQNYLFGLTEVGFVPYVLATAVGIIPGTILYVYLGTIGKAAGKGGGAAQWVLFGAGLAATVAVAVIVGRKAKQKLKETGVGREERK